LLPKNLFGQQAREGGGKNKHFVHRFTLLTQASRKRSAGRILLETTYFFQGKSMEEEKIDPGHSGLRNVFRVLGPVMLLVGLLFIVIGR